MTNEDTCYNYRLSAIRLQNFMAFEDTGWVELRPITLLFGRNSSGKSALIRFQRCGRDELMPLSVHQDVYSLYAHHNHSGR
ncbi:MAG: ATP-binding protein [Thermoflexales bacterium]|nr:ATP-binding protein [Thermoflexales bacterium]